MPRDITSVIEQLTPQQLARLGERLGVARPGGFLQPPIAQGAGLATALVPGLVETQFTETPIPVALNARSYYRELIGADQTIAASTSPFVFNGPQVKTGESWAIRVYACFSGAVGDTAGVGVRLGMSVGTYPSKSATLKFGQSGAALVMPAQSLWGSTIDTFLNFDKSAGYWVVIEGAGYVMAGNSAVQLQVQNQSATNAIFLKAGSWIEAARIS